MPEQAELVTVTQKRYRCRHVHAAGNQCGSPALRNEHFCYYHHTTRRPKPAPGKFRYIDEHEPFELPIVEDRASALAVASNLLQRIASNDLDPLRAGKLLYSMQIITKLLPGQPVPATATVPHAARTSDSSGLHAKRREPHEVPVPPPDLVEEIIDDKIHGLIAPQTELPSEPATPPVVTRSVENSTKCQGVPCQTKSDVGIRPTNPVILSEARSASRRTPTHPVPP